MYEQHFGLTERPFSIAPDPRFLYMSQRHREALAHLLYGVGEGGGFVQLTGEVGTGKTTICRCLLEQLPENVDVALILNPRVSALELVATLCDELQIDYPKQTNSVKTLTDALNAYLLEAHGRGRRTVMVIDEAQNLDSEALEQVRLLTNLETTREKLLQIILIGQPELRELLARDELRQLSQRITARYHLEPIVEADTEGYIRHRLEVCGTTEMLFSDKAVKLIQQYSEGIPRIINVLCDRALLGAYVEGRRQVNPRIVRRAAKEILPEESRRKPETIGWLMTALVSAGSVILALWLGPHLINLLTDPGDAVTEPVTRTAPASAPDADLATEIKALDTLTPDAVAAVPAVTAATDTPPELGSLLSAAGPEAVKHAWKALFREWGYQSSASSEERACAEARRVQLRCLRRGGSWNAVTQFDRPVLLMLAAPDGRRVPILLQRLENDQARIEIDGRSLTLPVAELQRFWFGDYRLLWQTPPAGHAVLRPGDRGSDVIWLKEQLQIALGLSAAQMGSNRYNNELKQLVEQFQLTQGLGADGVAGPETLIYLNTATGRPGVPRLVRPAAATGRVMDS